MFLKCVKQSKVWHRKFSSILKDDCKIIRGLVLGLYEKEPDSLTPRLSSIGEQFNELSRGKLQQLINESRIDGTLGTMRTFNNIHNQYDSICVVGCGKEGLEYNQLEGLHEGMENARIAAAIGARTLDAENCRVIHLEPMDYAEQVAEGATLALWKHQGNKLKFDQKKTPALELFDSSETAAFARGMHKANAQNITRKLSEMPANQATPMGFAQEAIEQLCPCGVTVEVRNQDWIESKNMKCLMAVSRSSCEKPVFLEITYCGGDQNAKPVLLVGNGLTFNSGGLSLKKARGMHEYRASMAGAAVVISTIRAAAQFQLPINLVAVIPLCENLNSGMSLKPGDILHTLNNKTIAVHDTSNVGVLMMADAFCYGIEFYKPKLIIDVATLADKMTNALGSGASGVFTNSHYLWKQIQTAGAYSGDRVWRLPLWKYFEKKVNHFSHVDLSNTGHGKGLPCLTAAVLREFCPCIDWLHLDICGVGMNATTNILPYLPPHQMTGRPTRTLIQLMYQLACPEAQQYWDIKEQR